jgi:hypothetical protein
MIRVLTMIAVAGFVLCVGPGRGRPSAAPMRSAAAGASSTAAISWGWSSPRYRHEMAWSDDYGKDTRTMAGRAEGLEIDPADVRYIQTPARARSNGRSGAGVARQIHGNSISARAFTATVSGSP